ncbi:MAG: 50S ribosomal protein L10, partial [Bacteroidia bacterium]|nr:50S ribosomal protein L10 [Bacteroidia bacterium]
VQTAKNSMIQKALERQENDYSEVFPHLKEFSTIIFVGEQANLPAKTIKEFRGAGELPKLKFAYIEQSLYVGNDSLEDLTKIKSKYDLIADVITLLQSPVKTVLGQLKSGGNTIMGIVETLSKKPE